MPVPLPRRVSAIRRFLNSQASSGIILMAAAALAVEKAGRKKDDPATQLSLGEMKNALAVADLAIESMIALADDLDFEPSLEPADASLVRRTLATNATIQVVEKAIDAVGGSAYFRKTGLERLLRDAKLLEIGGGTIESHQKNITKDLTNLWCR